MVEKLADSKSQSGARDVDGYDADTNRQQQSHETYTLNTEDGAETSAIDGLDPVYAAKARVLNRAIQNIGMGSYQWQLFVVVGFGWSMDNIWPIVTSLILPAIVLEFNVGRPPLLTLAQNIGLLAGAFFWGFGCDIFGRRWGFNLTLGERLHTSSGVVMQAGDMLTIDSGVTAVFGMISASSPNFAAIGVFAALWSFGVGGNLPVGEWEFSSSLLSFAQAVREVLTRLSDSAIFLEFLPASHAYLLTVLSIFWALAQLFATLVAWPLLGSMTCEAEATTCSRGENMGWRYFVIVIGGVSLVMFFIRFAVFTIFESPKYHMGKGRDDEAVRIVHEVARRNGQTSNLTVEDLRVCEGLGNGEALQTDNKALIKRKLAAVSGKHVKALFATKKLAFSTGAIMAVWAFIGLAFPLYVSRIPHCRIEI